MVQGAIHEHGLIDVIVNNAGIMTTVKEAGLATIDMKLEVIVISVSDGESRSMKNQTMADGALNMWPRSSAHNSGGSQ